MFVTTCSVLSANHKEEVKRIFITNRLHNQFFAHTIHWGASATTCTYGFRSSLVRAFNVSCVTNSAPLKLFVYQGPLASYRSLYYGGIDVIANSATRERLGVSKMADSESSTPSCYKCFIATFHVSGTAGVL
jgi:hypothetical protein